MKTVLILVTLLGGLSKCFAQFDSLPITITTKVDKEYIVTYSKNGTYIKDVIRRHNYVVKSESIKEKHFDISLTIKNTSDKTIKIWLMTCSWEDNFIVNNNYIYIRGHECDSNFPTLVEFKPGESKIYTNTLTKFIKFDYPCQNCICGPQVETTKLGLIIIDDAVGYDRTMEDKSKWRIVWSIPLYLLPKNESSAKSEIPVYQKKNDTSYAAHNMVFAASGA